MRLVCCLVLLLGGLQLSSALRVAAWNLETFGRSKANLDQPSPRKASILNYIARVVRRYDIIVLQEVRDDLANLPVINALLLAVNTINPAVRYERINSGPLGAGNYRERYVYLYRTTTVRVAASYQYRNPGPPAVTIARPPFVVRFQNLPGAAQTFDYTFIPLHATPDPNHQQTIREIDALVDVLGHVERLTNWRNPTPVDNVLFLGDFNAGCTYVRNSAQNNDFANIRLWTRAPGTFRVLIGSNQRTNVGGARACPYDRIVISTRMRQNVVANTARVYNFDQQMTLPVGVQATDISNHYPVEVQITP